MFQECVPYLPPPGNDKLMRLYAQTTYFENCRVFLRKGASWLQEYVDELTSTWRQNTMTRWILLPSFLTNCARVARQW